MPRKVTTTPPPFPDFKKKLENFIIITPDMARQDFPHLCLFGKLRENVMPHDKHKDTCQYPLCREGRTSAHTEEYHQRPGTQLEPLSYRDFEGTIEEGIETETEPQVITYD